MHPSAMRLGKAFFDTYGKNRDAATVIDIGSQNVNGSLKSVAPPHFKFVGLDFATGNGVDIVPTIPTSSRCPTRTSISSSRRRASSTARCSG